jgi:hypothetical protein
MSDKASSFSGDSNSGQNGGMKAGPETDNIQIFDKIVEDILKLMGFDILKDQFKGSYQYFDNILQYLAIKEYNGHSIMIGIKCKVNEAPTNENELMSFLHDLQNYGIKRGLFVSYGGFTDNIDKWSFNPCLELWDNSDVISRWRLTGGISLSGDDMALSVNLSLNDATRLDLINSDKVRIMNVNLTYIPFIICDYGFTVNIVDHARNTYTYNESGKKIIDAMEFKVLKADNVLINDHDKKILEEIQNCEPSKNIEPGSDLFQVKVAYPAISLDSAKIIFKRRSASILKNYMPRLKDGANNTFDLQVIKPKPSDVRVNSIFYVYVPVWEVEYQSKDMLFLRKILAGSGRVLRDDIKKCSECDAGDTILVCEECGRAFCKRHIHKCSDCDTYLCIDHINTCVSCGRHFCDIHKETECSTAERYRNLLALRKPNNSIYLRVMGVLLLFSSIILIIYIAYGSYRALFDTIISLLFFGGPLTAIIVSTVLFGCVLVTLNQRKSRTKSPEELMPVLLHKIVKGKN